MIKTALAKLRRMPLLTLLAGSGLILLAVTLLPAASGDTVADSELGQFDFAHSTVDFVRAQGFALSNNTPAPGIAIDAVNGCVYVADQSNNRVLGWRNADSLSNGLPADFVIGQQDFYSDQADSGGPSNLNLTLSGPAGVAVDLNGNLYVADTGNQRVTEYATPCTAPLGTFFSANSTIPVADPWGVATDANGDLFVTDTKNSRVLVYNTPLNSPQKPNGIIGQTVGTFCNQSQTAGAPPAANTLCTPYGVAVDNDDGALYVADTGNNRVVAYVPQSPGNFGTNPSALIVLGQHKLTENTSGCGQATNATALCAPRGVTIDANRNLYIADTNNNRVTEYNDPAKYSGGTPEAATLIFGQSGPTGNAANAGGGGLPTQDGLWTPAGVANDGHNLWVLDNHNYRALEFTEPVSGPSNTTPAFELGQFDFVHSTPNFVDGAAYSNMSSVVVDRNSAPTQHLYVVDSKNNRVLGYKDATSFQNGQAADLVVGQPDFYTNTCNSLNAVGPDSPPSATTLCLALNPNQKDVEGGAAAVDSQGNLWVSDIGNSRILEFPSPFDSGVTADEAATVVLGQTGFTTVNTSCGAATQTNFCEPAGLAFDSKDNLYAADFGYNRVLEFTTPGGTNNQSAHLVLGQGAAGNVFAQSGCNTGSTAPSASSLCKPLALALDKNDNLYVADFNNSRVLEFDDPLALGGGTPGISGSAGDVTADLVYGQGTTGGTSEFTTATCGNGGTSPGEGAITANSLCNPAGVTVDPFGSVFVADQANNRVLGYAESSSSNPPANVTPGIVFGQVDYTSGQPNQGGALTASSLNLAVISTQQDGLATDLAGDLFVVDAGNIRMLEYDGGFLSAPTPTATGSGSPTPTDTATPTITPTQTITPTPVADSLKITPKSISFPKELLIGLNGVTSPVKKITLKVPAKGPAITVIGMNTVNPFAMDPATTTCQENVPILPGQKCVIGLTYTPDLPGDQSGVLTIKNNGPQHELPITLTGTGEAGKIKIKPAGTLSFKKTTVGSTSAPATVTLTNDNSLPITMGGVSIPPPGSGSPEFAVSDPNNCAESGETLAPQSSCAVTVTFSPDATGKQTGSLSISDDVAGAPQTVKLKGTGG